MSTSTSKRSSLLPREGLRLDALLLFLRKLTHPLILVPLLATLNPTISGTLTKYLPLPSSLPIAIPALSPSWIKSLKYLTYLGVFHRVNAFLSKGALNNWEKDHSYDWDKEVIVVTGGSSGIGKELVLWLSDQLLNMGKRGGRIVVLDIIDLEYDAPVNVSYVKCDLTSYESIKAGAEQVRAQYGSPTVLVNNAGVCRGKHILTATPADLDFVFRVNTIAHWYLAQEFLPYMIEKNHGHIVTVASVGAYVQAPKMVDYNASKAATLSFHEGLGLELRGVYGAKKVRTTVVTPGYVKTPLFEGYNNTSEFLVPALHPQTVAEEIGKAILSGEGGHIVLPRGYYALTGIRGWFSWAHMRTLGRVIGVMDNWNGRQVMEPK